LRLPSGSKVQHDMSLGVSVGRQGMPVRSTVSRSSVFFFLVFLFLLPFSVIFSPSKERTKIKL
jgi:hypothetical protein